MNHSLTRPTVIVIAVLVHIQCYALVTLSELGKFLSLHIHTMLPWLNPQINSTKLKPKNTESLTSNYAVNTRKTNPETADLWLSQQLLHLSKKLNVYSLTIDYSAHIDLSNHGDGSRVLASAEHTCMCAQVNE